MMIPARIPMMAITTRSSMRVKADEDSGSFGFIITIIYCYGYIMSGGGEKSRINQKSHYAFTVFLEFCSTYSFTISTILFGVIPNLTI